MDMTAIGIVSIPFVFVLALVALDKIGKGGFSSKDRKAQAEETRMIQDLYKGLGRMEERMEALETIIIEREREKRKNSDA